MLDAPHEQMIKSGILSGLLFGFSQVMTFIVVGLIFYVGSIFRLKYGV